MIWWCIDKKQRTKNKNNGNYYKTSNKNKGENYDKNKSVQIKGKTNNAYLLIFGSRSNKNIEPEWCSFSTLFDSFTIIE